MPGRCANLLLQKSSIAFTVTLGTSPELFEGHASQELAQLFYNIYYIILHLKKVNPKDCEAFSVLPKNHEG
jgi:hypothetical protein